LNERLKALVSVTTQIHLR